MKFDIKNRKNILISVTILILIVSVFSLFKLSGKADAYANQIAMKNVSLAKIDTGSGPFKTDGLNYSDSTGYSKDTDYIAGADENENNRIVRSFDTLKYYFDFEIKGKNVANDYEERKVNIKVSITSDEAKYLTFDPNEKAGETSHTFTFDGIDTYDSFRKEIILYVLGAPNGMQIKPKFEIQESTNTDTSEIITLGNVSGETYNYDYDSEKTNKYSTTSNTVGFMNYMPTIVSSSTASVAAMFSSTNEEFQRVTYNDETGRYLTTVLNLYIVGDSTTGVKGLAMPKDNSLSIPILIQNTGGTLSVKEEWTRLYSPNAVGDITPMIFDSPYSTTDVDLAKRTRFPGNVKLTKNDDDNYTLDVTDFSITYKSATSTASNSSISQNFNYIGSYAISVFSGRTASDATRDIVVGFGVRPYTFIDTNGNNRSLITTEGRPTNLINKYYEVIDYSLIGEFYDGAGGIKLSSNGTNGYGSVSKGTNLIYRTTFSYKKTLSNQGLKEVIKFDPNAYRVVPLSDKKDIKITIVGEEGSNLSEDDFEISYVSGNYNSSNYSGNSSLDRINSEDQTLISDNCSTVSNNLSSYSVDQIQNLYGGPCITPREGVENKYEKITAAKIKNENGTEIEDPITKVIVQTKDGVKLPDTVRVIIDVGVRVRNVSDLTQTYQATAVATSSDYDSNLSYYSPRVVDNNKSITNPDNYTKTIYNGKTIQTVDTQSFWGDSLRIVNFTSRETITVTNKNTDGTTKINYNVVDNETLNYNIKTVISDNNELVGADDTWYINSLRVEVLLPSDLTYIEDKKLGSPEVISNADGTTLLIYTLPYTKPNQKIKDINFKSILKPTLTGTGKEVKVTSTVKAININNEEDNSYIGYLSDSFSIYATGIQNVIVSQKVGSTGSVIEKNSEFSYILNAYNNVGSKIDDYNIVDILPYSGDDNGSKFSGKYKVKVSLPASLSKAKVTCSNQAPSKLTNEVFNNNNVFEECNITEDYVDVTAIQISGISINANDYMGDIIVFVKPEGNNYSDKYINSFIGGSRTYSEVKSNKIETRVVSRNISGRVFVDMDEDGIEEEGDKYLSGLLVTIYKINPDNEMVKVDSTTTDSNGKYIFKDLDVGRYKIQVNYKDSLYDLTLRYATEDYEHDSDGYKIQEGLAEIGYTRTIDDNDAVRDSVQELKVTREVESIEDLNIGLINRKNFGFDMSKYITKIDLSYNNSINTLNYDNQTKVSISVKNSLKATAKVYYGITLTNNSSQPGYAKLVQEDIPNGMIFDPNDDYNSEWFSAGGVAHSIAFEKDIIYPGESRYLKIALYMPRQEQATTFINTVTMLEIEPYEPEKLADDKNADSNSYAVGEALSYAGVNWHVIDVGSGNNDGEQYLTLLADSGTIAQKSSHSSGIYKWSDSQINNYINNDWINSNTLNTPILLDQEVCNDASGTPNQSYGGTLKFAGTCTTNDYRVSKVRLLTEAEYNSLKSSTLSDLSWLRGNNNFWLTNSDWIKQEHDPYGQITAATNVSKKAKYVNSTNGEVLSDLASSNKEIRPVITISNKNVIPE